MKLSEAIPGFLDEALGEGYSPQTLKGYQSSLNRLLERVGDKELKAVTREDLVGFMKWLRVDYKPERADSEALSTASIHRYWKAMRSFFKWADRTFDTGRPEEKIKMPAFSHKVIHPFTEDEYHKLLKACEKIPVETSDRDPYEIVRPTRLRDGAIIRVLLDTGIRVGELCRLKIEDLDYAQAEIHVRPHHVRKTRPRILPLGRLTKSALWRYLADRPDRLPQDPLFVNLHERAMTEHAVQILLRRIGERAGAEDVHPHRFRHTFAIQYLRNGGDIYSLRTLMGHATLAMVMHYLDLAQTDVAQAHRQASPGDRWR